jgi:hypothetical protein
MEHFNVWKMSTPYHPMRPAKRRRIKGNDPLRENDVEALDAVTVEHVTVKTRRGPAEIKKLVPIPQATSSSHEQDHNPLPDIPYESNDDFFQDENIESGAVPASPAVPSCNQKANIISFKCL